MIKISVSASRNYDVIMERDALTHAGEYVKAALGLQASLGKKICIITDATVDRHYGQRNHALWRSLVEAGFDVYKYVFVGGEHHKNMDTVSAILEFLANNRFSRSDVLLALGGGITGDVTGFAAASYLRGVEFIQAPTSMLAVVDSSVGGKTGVNLSAGKNLAGAFWQPSLVLFDPDVLATLSNALKMDGIAEAIKAGIIADPAILELAEEYCGANLPETPSADATKPVILRDTNFLMILASKAIEVKRRIVEEDEREGSIRQLLNLGHTLAHAIEKSSEYEIRHGHAVAIGMDIVSAAADALEWSEEKCHPRIRSILKKFGFPLDCPYTPKELASAALQDKKIRGSDITLVIPSKIGKCCLKTIATDKLEHFIACGLAGV